MISWDDFEKVELRVGRVLTARVFPEARKPAYILEIDFGDEVGIKKTSAQITDNFENNGRCDGHKYSFDFPDVELEPGSPDDELGGDGLPGTRVVAVVNFPKKQIGPFMSECLVTGFHDDEGRVVLCRPESDVPLGSKLA